jgi:hypothetical protein
VKKVPAIIRGHFFFEYFVWMQPAVSSIWSWGLGATVLMKRQDMTAQTWGGTTSSIDLIGECKDE